ncbi:gamma-glutamyl-gamma-aminobutyrate hydrolase PuuD [Enterococcus sp. PF1-24]|nr:gamma-glutamyl-gamma-aminobutyrate hydrolase PuuD [Enterococcus sp. PFB1-1]MDH6401903.1 gamma-glutamyl-gamma-aminobutyrate hydrolase PuuD [Enterococcus sp. PF1-24]
MEAFESIDDSQRILGVQWHPELTHHVNRNEQQLFDYFVHEL